MQQTCDRKSKQNISLFWPNLVKCKNLRIGTDYSKAINLSFMKLYIKSIHKKMSQIFFCGCERFLSHVFPWKKMPLKRSKSDKIVVYSGKFLHVTIIL